MVNKILVYISLIGLICISGFLRLYKLDQAPASVNWDEASYAYNAKSLWLTGKDEYGTALPSSIRSFDDYKPPIYAYLTAPIVGVWGLNETTARIVSVVFGILALPLIFVLATRLSKSAGVGVIAAAVFGTAPMIIHFSRVAFEGGVALPLFLAGLIFFVRNKKNYDKSWGLFLIMLSAFAYNSHKVYFALAVLWLMICRGWKFWRIKNLFWVSIISFPLAIVSVFTPALARFSGTSIFPLFSQTKSIYLFAGEIINRYIGYFSITNIFVRGTNEPGQQVLGFGVMYVFLAIPWILGMITIWRNHKYRFLRWWLFMAPLPAVLTWNWFTPVRVVPYWALVSIVIAVGIYRLKKWRLLVIFGLIWWTINCIWTYERIIFQMPYTQYGRWQWGFRETMTEISDIQNNYDEIVWDTPQAQPYIFVLFYGNYPPALYQNQIDSQTKSGQARTFYDFGKYKFRKIYWPKDREAKRTLFIGDPYALPLQDLERDKAKIIKEIKSPEGYIVYRLVGT